MLHPSTKKLIDKLIEMTASSKISWTEGDDGACIYDTEGYRVTIGQSPSRVVLLDAGGRVLETVSESLLANTKDDAGLLYTVKVDQLVSDARRQITGAADVMDRIVSALDLGGSSDADELVEEDEDASPPPNMIFPDEGEMTSRVALLAESVNSAPPAEEAEEAEELQSADEPDTLTTSPEDAGASPWSMPDAEPVDDFSTDDASKVAEPEPAENAPVMATSPTFGAIGSFGGSSEKAIETPEPVEAPVAEPEIMEPVVAEPEPAAIVHEAATWDSAALMDASIMVAEAFVETSVKDEAPVEVDTPEVETDVEAVPKAEPAIADNVVEFTPFASETADTEPDTITEDSEPDEESVSEVAPPEPIETEAPEETASEPEAEAKDEPEDDPPPARRTVYKYNPWM